MGNAPGSSSPGSSSPGSSSPGSKLRTDRALDHWKNHECEITFRAGLSNTDFSGHIIELGSQPAPWAVVASRARDLPSNRLLNVLNLRQYCFQRSDARMIPRVKGEWPQESETNLRHVLASFAESELIVCTPRGEIRGMLYRVIGGPGTAFVLIEPKKRQQVWVVNFDNCLRIMLPSSETPLAVTTPSDLPLEIALQALVGQDCTAHTTFDTCWGRFGLVVSDESNIGPKVLLGSSPQLSRNLGMMIPWQLTHALEFKLDKPLVLNQKAASTDTGGDGDSLGEVPAFLDDGPRTDGAHAATAADDEDEFDGEPGEES